MSASPAPELSAALERISPRHAQVLIRTLLERRGPAECAAFYGVSAEGFAALLARALEELAGALAAPGASPDAGRPVRDDRGASEASFPDTPAQAGRAALQAHLAALAGLRARPGSQERASAGADRDLGALAERLWQLGPRALPPRRPEEAESRWARLLRLAVIAALLASVAYAARVFA